MIPFYMLHGSMFIFNERVRRASHICRTSPGGRLTFATKMHAVLFFVVFLQRARLISLALRHDCIFNIWFYSFFVSSLNCASVPYKLCEQPHTFFPFLRIRYIRGLLTRTSYRIRLVLAEWNKGILNVP